MRSVVFSSLTWCTPASNEMLKSFRFIFLISVSEDVGSALKILSPELPV